MKKMLVIMPFLLLLCNIAFFGCGTKDSGVALPLKIGVLPVEDNLPFFVAQEDGLYQKSGLQVELVPFDSAAERDAAFIAGQIDGETSDIVAAALLKKAGTDAKIGSIALGATPQEGRFALLAAPKSEIDSVSGMAKHSLGISENTIIEYVADRILHDGGIDQGKVIKVSIPKITVRLEMLLNGKVDAALLPDPIATLAEFQGAKVLSDDTYANISQVVLVFSGQAIKDKKSAIRELIKIYGNAGELLTKQPEKYRDTVLTNARVPAPIQNTYQSPVFSSPRLPSEEEVNMVLVWMKEKGLLDREFRYQDLVDATLLP